MQQSWRFARPFRTLCRVARHKKVLNDLALAGNEMWRVRMVEKLRVRDRAGKAFSRFSGIDQNVLAADDALKRHGEPLKLQV
jgi:hypothetical protein